MTIDLQKYKTKAIIITGIGTFMGTLDSSIVNVSLPTISRELGTSIDLVGWVVLSYAITVFSLLMVFGALAGKKGYQFSYTYGYSIFFIGSALCGISTSIYMLIISRIIQGVGGALMISVGPALVTHSFPPAERGRGLSFIVMIVSTGLMLGPPLGGFIVSYLGWRWIFYVNLPISLIGILLTRRFIADFPISDPDKKIGIPSAISLFLGLISLLMSLLLFSKQILSAPAMIGLVLFSIFAFLSFFYLEKRLKNKLIGIDIFKNRIFVLSGISVLLTFIALISISILLPFYLEKVKNLRPDTVGLYLMIIPFCTLALSRLAGFLADKFPARIISTIGTFFILSGIFTFSNLSPDSTRWYIIGGLTLIGIGMAIFGTPNTSAIMGSVRKYQLGSAAGIIATIRTLGIALGAGLSIAIFSYYQNMYLIDNLNDTTAFMMSYKNVYKLMILIMAGGLIFSALRGDNLNNADKEIK